MRRLLLLFGLAAGLCACADDSGSVLPTPLATPTLPAQSVIIYVLGPAQVPGYRRTTDQTLNAGAVADEKGDPSLAARLGTDGFIHGAQAAYTPPPSTATPAFTAITSDALLFSDATGAGTYFTEEANRINTVPQGGTLDALGGLPRQHVDVIVGYASSQPPQGGDPVDRAFIVLMRSGRVVTEVFARGADPTLTTAAAFLPLVTADQALLARSPNT